MAKVLVRILIVDDAKAIRTGLKGMLNPGENFEYLFLEADNGEEALRICREETPDCVLLDFQLPGIDGIEVLKTLREEENNVPVVMVTGQGDELVAIEALAYGAQEFLAKGGFNWMRLSYAVHNAIHKELLHKVIQQQSKILEQSSEDIEEAVKSLELLGKTTSHTLEDVALDAFNRALDLTNRIDEMIRDVKDLNVPDLDVSGIGPPK